VVVCLYQDGDLCEYGVIECVGDNGVGGSRGLCVQRCQELPFSEALLGTRPWARYAHMNHFSNPAKHSSAG
jgi:hypothetical protein